MAFKVKGQAINVLCIWFCAGAPLRALGGGGGKEEHQEAPVDISSSRCRCRSDEFNTQQTFWRLSGALGVGKGCVCLCVCVEYDDMVLFLNSGKAPPLEDATIGHI